MLDTSKIEGYAEMSAEEKVKALEALEIEDNAAELERYKNATTKANSEAAEYKRKLKALEEKASQGSSDTEKQIADLKEQIETLNREKSISERTASFLKIGMSEDIAGKCSEAFTNGDSEAFFAAMGSFITEHDKAFKAELLKSTPRPGSEGGKAPEMTKEKLKKMSLEERMAFANEFPDEYNKIYGG